PPPPPRDEANSSWLASIAGAVPAGCVGWSQLLGTSHDKVEPRVIACAALGPGAAGAQVQAGGRFDRLPVRSLRVWAAGKDLGRQALSSQSTATSPDQPRAANRGNTRSSSTPTVPADSC